MPDTVADIRIGIVEDNHEFRNALQLILGGTPGYACTSVFSNAEEAIKRLALEKPDIVLMDIQLPGMSGIDCIKQIKSEAPDIQFMMFTSYEDDEKIFDALAAGASGYILKRTPPAKLIEAVRELYEGGSPMSTEIARKVVGSFQQKKRVAGMENNPLSEREKQILDQLADGFMYKEIASNLFISIATVKQHVHRIYEKLHVQSRTGAINKYYSR
ncbi:MAG: response regulator transcription factor [Saprospiraceae bacterium]